MSSDFERYITEDRRIAILIFLSKVDGTASESVIHKAMREVLYPRLTRAQVREDLDWLRQHGLLTHEWLNDELLVATLTARGLDCARGDIEVEGVAKPSRIK